MPNVFYERTDQGQAAAYDASSILPRKLKSLLKVIDGKTSQAVFANSLKAFGDVQGLLASLQSAGLIELREQAAQQPSQALASNTLLQPSANGLAASIAIKFGFHANRDPANSDGFALTQGLHTQPQRALEIWQISPERAAQRENDLQAVLEDMSSFVLTYVPDQAVTVLTELEQTTTMEQLAVLMGGYQLMVSAAGEQAVIHLNDIRSVLSRWL